MSTDVRFFVGIDWASETHQVCLVAADGKIIGERAFAHGGAGLAEMCDWLVTTSGEEPPKIAVAIEAPHGPIVEILLERRFQVDAVNPKQLDRFRDRFTVAGAKDDRRDAYVLADALANRPALLPPARGRRPGRDRAARVVAHGRGPAAGAQPACQPRPRATLALLSAGARTR